MTARGNPQRGGAALAAALVSLVVAAALALAMADVTRTEVQVARARLVAGGALAAADACLAQAVAGIPPGWDFAALRLGPDGLAGTADDGVLGLPAGCTGSAGPEPAPAGPPRLRLTIEGRAGGGRRVIDALVRRAAAPGLPALLWFTEPPTPGTITGTVALDGADASDPALPDSAALAAPAEPEALDAWVAGEGAHVVSTPRTTPPLAAWPPPLAALGARVRTAGPAGAEALVAAGPPPRLLALVGGDLTVADVRAGAGLLFVDGTLDIEGVLDFTGVLVASGGVRIGTGARLAVTGALWLGTPAAAGPGLVVDGQLALRPDRAALESADGLLELPRQPIVLALRDAS